MKPLLIINAEAKWRFNFMQWEASRPGEGGGLSINIVNLLDEISSAIASSAGSGNSGANEKYWEDSLHHLNTNLVELALLAGSEITLPILRSILVSAALKPETVHDPEWQQNSYCGRALTDAEIATRGDDHPMRPEYEEVRNYWLVEYPNLDEKPRGITALSFSMLVRPLITHPLREIFTTTTNIKPEDTFDGKIIIVDLPVQEFRLVGRIANLVWKYCFQIAVLRRMQPTDRQTFLRPVFLWADEAQNFVSKFDSEYQAVARSAAGCTVYLTQNLESFENVLKNPNAVASLLGNLQAKFFCQNAGNTNEWASRLLGSRWVNINSTSVNRSESDGGNGGSRNAGVSQAEQQRAFVEPARFTTLKRGGQMHNFQVEAIVYKGGHLFDDGEEPLPYRLLTFDQK